MQVTRARALRPAAVVIAFLLCAATPLGQSFVAAESAAATTTTAAELARSKPDPQKRGYRETFFNGYPSSKGRVVVHHSIEWQVLRHWPGLFTPAELNALDNLRGIPKGSNSAMHLHEIRRGWDRFYKRFPPGRPAPTRAQVIAHRNNLDWVYGRYFWENDKRNYRDDGWRKRWRERNEELYGDPFVPGAKHPKPKPPAEEGAPGQPPGFDESMRGAAEKNPGGIDFSTLSLRYLSVGEEGADEGSRYAFKSDQSRDAVLSTPEDGAWAAKQASDAFFVWLALSPDTFWVNLKPDEPDRVVDAKLGRTDAGRVLLEADLLLKKTVGKIIHPDSRSGRQFWSRLQGVEGRRCFSSRVWITPGEAKVREDDDQLYILDAPLKVQMEQERLKGGVTSQCPDLPAAVNKRNEALYRRMVLPRLVYAVNHAPEYAALRRVYTSRVAAEWYRTRTEPDQSGFAEIAGSGDISKWELRGKWSPRSTYQRFLHSYQHGEFKKRQRTIRGDKIWIETMTYGGVVFANVLMKALSDESFARYFPEVSQQVERLFDQGVAKPSSQSWMGGAVPASGEPAAAPPSLPELPDLRDLELEIPEMPDLDDLEIPDELLPPEPDEDGADDEPAASLSGKDDDKEPRAHPARALAVKVAPYSLPVLLIEAGLVLLITALVRRSRRGGAR